MMKATTKNLLLEWADLYETEAFIPNDPIQFPHRFSHVPDVEIAGLLTAWISFGNRKMILRKADELMGIMKHKPLEYVLSQSWREDFPASDTQSFYRTCPKKQMHQLLHLLFNTYSNYSSLEEALQSFQGTPRERLCHWLGVSDKSPQKKLNMFLRWMIRQDSPVDLGIWHSFDAAELVIPLDTHVTRVAHELGITGKPSYSLRQALQITDALNEVFPNDPCRGDFALFGFGVERTSL